MIRLQISKQIIVTGGLFITFCRVVMVYKDILMNSRRTDVELDCSAKFGGGCTGLAPSPLPIKGPMQTGWISIIES